MFGPAAPANDSEKFSYSNIYRNYLKCRRNKRNSLNALRFEINAEENIIKIERNLKNKTYYPSRCILFTAQKPKVREIFASDFSDRVIHHVLIGELTKIWEPQFIHDSYACREGKGTHKAVTRLQSFLRKDTENGNVKTFYLQLDIKDFFISINKEILFNLIKNKITDKDTLWLAKTTIFWDCTKDYVKKGSLANIPENKSLFGKNNERGLPIGNLTSQFFANIYLDQLDQYVKHTLKAKHYLRYVDDFIILSHCPEELLALKSNIEAFLIDKLKLILHPKRHKLLPVSTGIDFLGYIVRHDYILNRRRVVNNLKQKIRDFSSSNTKDFKKLDQTIASYKGHFKWANSYKLKNRLNDKYTHLKRLASNGHTPS